MKAGAEKTEEAAYNDRLSEYLAWLMDSSIQIGPVSFGLDGLIGPDVKRIGHAPNREGSGAARIAPS